MDSILLSVKKVLGIEAEYTQFDADIIMAINAVLLSVNQVGVGPESGFVVTSESETWTQLLGTRTDIEAVKTYISLKTRLIFDPPQQAFLIDAIERTIKELEWRVLVQVENTLPEVTP